MTALSFTIPRPPRSWKRTTLAHGKRVTTAEQRSYQQLVAGYATQAIGKARRTGVTWPLDADCYALTCVFWMPTRAAADVDNLAKNVMDSCQSVLWSNDARIASLMSVRGHDAKNPRTVVTAIALTERQHVSALASLIMSGAA